MENTRVELNRSLLCVPKLSLKFSPLTPIKFGNFPHTFTSTLRIFPPPNFKNKCTAHTRILLRQYTLIAALHNAIRNYLLYKTTKTQWTLRAVGTCAWDVTSLFLGALRCLLRRREGDVAIHSGSNTPRFGIPMHWCTEFYIRYFQIANNCTRRRRIFKGTQDWEFFWLRFWNLRYFFVSYA